MLIRLFFIVSFAANYPPISCRDAWKWSSGVFTALYCAFGLRSKNGLFDDALMAMAIVWLQPGSQLSVSDDQPAEKSTRVSTRMSDAMAHAEPMAMPTSIELMAHGFSLGLSSQVG